MVTEEIRYTPKPANRRALFATLSLLIPAICLFVASNALPGYGGMVQIIAIFLLVPALFIAYKFILTSYTYILKKPGDGIAYLMIEQTQGRRSSLVCHLPLHAVFRVVANDKEVPSGKAYVYVASMSGGRYQYVIGRLSGASVLLKLEADDAFIESLMNAAAAARRAEAEE